MIYSVKLGEHIVDCQQPEECHGEFLLVQFLLSVHVCRLIALLQYWDGSQNDPK